MTQLLSVTWDFNPTFIRLGSLDIRWYGLTWALGFIIGYLFFINFCKREKLSAEIPDTAFWYVTLSAIIGSRLGHCLFYEPGFYLSHPLQILNLRAGGMASHGAAIGLLIGLWLLTRKCRLPYVWALDRITIPVAVAGAAVRFGNLFNSEIYGLPTDLPWGFIFVRAGETVPKHPTQIYEALCYLVVFVILLLLYYRRDAGRRNPGLIFGVGLIGIFLSRFLIEFVKNPQVDFEQGMPLVMGQLLSIPFIIAGIVMTARGLRSKEQDLSESIRHYKRLEAAKRKEGRR